MQSCLQSEMFLSNSVDMMKNLLVVVKAVGSNERIAGNLCELLKYNSSISKIGVAFRFSSWMHFLLLTFSILKSEFTLVPTLFEGYTK